MTTDHPDPPDQDALDEAELLREEREAFREDHPPLSYYGL